MPTEARRYWRAFDAELFKASTLYSGRISLGAIVMARRRVSFVLLVLAFTLGLLALMGLALEPGGYGILDWAILAMFALVAPWLSIGVCNALVGVWLIWLSKNPWQPSELGDGAIDSTGLKEAGQSIAQATTDTQTNAQNNTQSLTHTKTALLLCVRNETPARLVRNLDLMLASLVAQGAQERYHLYVLSDTTEGTWAAREALAFEAVSDRWRNQVSLTYRRRTTNTGFKAGNIEAFCQQSGGEHEFAVVLDADSLMSAKAVDKLVNIMLANPQVGILQGLVVGLPSGNAFTRLFQFGMRLGMRSYTLGSAWWQGDCGPYWGHNAVIRMAPFMAYCQLPVWQDRRGKLVYVLSHDQLEAVMMRRGGYEVRVYPFEDESFEENPPNLLDFIQRDLRWCAGNLQYVSFLSMPGLKATSRIQLFLAILMFLSGPAWLLGIGLLLALLSQSANVPAVLDLSYAWPLLAMVWVMILMPKLGSAVIVLLRSGQRRAFGGGLRFGFSFVLEILFSTVISPIMWLSQSLFMVRTLFGKRTGWVPQNRDDSSVGWLTATKAFWMHTLIGLLMALPLAMTQPLALLPLSLFIGGLWLAIPFSVLSANPALGRFMQRRGWMATPDEVQPSVFIKELARVVDPTRAIADLNQATFESGR